MFNFSRTSIDTSDQRNHSTFGPAVLSCETVAAYCHHLFYNLSHDQMEDCFLSLCFEPRKMKPVQLYTLTIVYVFIFVTGAVGNVTTCVVMRKAGRQSPSTTNRYLCNLAAADLISLLSGAPFEIYLGWNQYPWHPPDFFCHAKAWILETTSYVSVLTIVAFSLERYLAVCHSLSASSALVGYRRRISRILFVIWFAAAICASPYGFYHKVDYVLRSWPSDPDYGPVKKTKMCMFALAFDPTLKSTFAVIFHASAAVFFFIPLLALVFLYWRMAVVIMRSRQDVMEFRNGTVPVSSAIIETSTVFETNCESVREADSGGGKVPNRSRSWPYSRKTFYMLAAVVVAFFFCYAPFQIHRLLFFCDEGDAQQMVNTYLYFISGIMFYLSSVINPILYSVLSWRFRSAFAKLLCLCKGRSNSAIRVQDSHISRGERQYSLVSRRRTRTPSPTKSQISPL